MIEALREGKSYEVELELNQKLSGPARWVSARGEAVRDASGKIIGLRGTAQDITDRKLAEIKRNVLETQLLQAQKMKAIGTLAGGIAHDFNNILCIIMANTAMLDAALDEGQKAKQYLHPIIKAGERASDLIKHLLAFGSPKDLKKTVVNFDSSIDNSLKLLRATIPSSVAINVRLGTGKAGILADETQIHQVVMNLVTNAWQAIPKGTGTIDIFTDVIETGSETTPTGETLPPERYARLQIHDNGHGIPKEMIGRVFEPFFTTKGVGEGTGLGLAVVHGVTLNHGGSIAVESEVGVGTTFKLLFPILSEATSSSEPHQKSASPTPAIKTGARLFVVDDEVDLLALIQECLSNLGYTIVVFNSPESALSVLRNMDERCDLLITDLSMPEMTGLQLIEEVRKLRPSLPAIMVTGNATPQTRLSTERLGVQLLPKPWRISSLNGAVQNGLKLS